ncbi:MAG: YeeE/YedE family protein [Pseudomonadota bacterium]
MNILAACVAGIVFGIGLSVSGMTNPANVLAFLTLTSGWQPHLMLVMGSALGVAAVGYNWVLRRAKPLYAEQFQLPIQRHIDGRLIAGSVLFGIGWGLSGYCPGPALISGFALDNQALLFCAALLVGAAAHELLTKLMERPAEPIEPEAGT